MSVTRESLAALGLPPAEIESILERARVLAQDRSQLEATRAVVTAAQTKGAVNVDRLQAFRIRDSLLEFVRAFWHVVEPGTTYIEAKHIVAICEHLQAVADGRITRLLVNISPGHAKSLLIAVMFPAWMWLRNPGWRVLCGSYSQDLSIRDAQRSRDVIRSAEYEAVKEALGLTWTMDESQDLKSHFQNTAKGFRLALAVGGKATGFRGDCLLFDDLCNVKEPEKITKESLAEARAWWNVTMSSRLNDLRKGTKIGIMQRVSEFDPCDELIKRKLPDGRWEYDLLALPSEYDPDLLAALGRPGYTETSIGWKDWRTQPGELLFPELFPREVLEQAKIDLGSLMYAANHGQRPTPASGGFFKREWWRYWVPPHAEMPEPVTVPSVDARGKSISWECPQIKLPPVTGLYISADLAFKDTVGSDYVAIQCWAYGAADPYRSSRFLLDQVCRKMDFVATLQAFREFVARWPQASLKLIEAKANGPAVISALRAEMSGLVAVEPLGGKEARANAVSPQIESGHVYIPHPRWAPWVDAFLAQCTSFPKGAHDDQVDAMTQALARKRTVVV